MKELAELIIKVNDDIEYLYVKIIKYDNQIDADLQKNDDIPRGPYTLELINSSKLLPKFKSGRKVECYCVNGKFILAI